MLVTDVGDGFGLFSPLSYHKNVWHQHSKDVTRIEIRSPTFTNLELTNITMSTTSMSSYIINGDDEMCWWQSPMVTILWYWWNMWLNIFWLPSSHNFYTSVDYTNLILSPISKYCHQRKVTNITVTPTSFFFYLFIYQEWAWKV